MPAGVLTGGGAEGDAAGGQGQCPAFGIEEADVAVGLRLRGGAVVGADVVDVEGGWQGGVLRRVQMPDELPVPVDEQLPLPALDAVEVVVRGDVVSCFVGVLAEGTVRGVARPEA